LITDAKVPEFAEAKTFAGGHSSVKGAKNAWVFSFRYFPSSSLAKAHDGYRAAAHACVALGLKLV
jgi:hypothetical protein